AAGGLSAGVGGGAAVRAGHGDAELGARVPGGPVGVVAGQVGVDGPGAAQVAGFAGHAGEGGEGDGEVDPRPGAAACRAAAPGPAPEPGPGPAGPGPGPGGSGRPGAAGLGAAAAVPLVAAAAVRSAVPEGAGVAEAFAEGLDPQFVQSAADPGFAELAGAAGQQPVHRVGGVRGQFAGGEGGVAGVLGPHLDPGVLAGLF